MPVTPSDTNAGANSTGVNPNTYGVLTNIGLYSYKVKHFEELKEGARVDFELAQGPKGLMATHIRAEGMPLPAS